ncbi:hypothetical protein BVC80_1289g33 [Macleaya cordata]|uniref:Uncharacterized protein n=1 Tax=Macleaya cordata TaxID=56857 RepID=A0A200Q9P4_MACCD|nr:hypothetical protein BVC80_1289g33 [Macleaya cordata]
MYQITNTITHFRTLMRTRPSVKIGGGGGGGGGGQRQRGHLRTEQTTSLSTALFIFTFRALQFRLQRCILPVSIDMGNKPAEKQQKEEVLVKIVPPLDRAYVRWLTRDLERIHGFTPKNQRAIEPPQHYIDYMRLNGWLDLNLDDPDLAHLFK